MRSVAQESIGIYWTAIADATGYSIQVQNVNNNNDYHQYPTVPINSPTTSTLTGLVPGAVYDIHLQAILINKGDTKRQATSKYHAFVLFRFW